jgi:hypothetical protein
MARRWKRVFVFPDLVSEGPVVPERGSGHPRNDSGTRERARLVGDAGCRPSAEYGCLCVMSVWKSDRVEIRSLFFSAPAYELDGCLSTPAYELDGCLPRTPQPLRLGNKLATVLATSAQCRDNVPESGPHRNRPESNESKCHSNVCPIPRVWQKSRTQNPVVARGCGFKPQLRC